MDVPWTLTINLLQFPITALREIRILQLLKHENVVNLIEIVRTKASRNNKYKSIFYLVFDFCEHDLAGLLSNVHVKFSLGEIKKVMKQLLDGLYYIHTNKVRWHYSFWRCQLYPDSLLDPPSWHESSECSHHKNRSLEVGRFWSRACIQYSQERSNEPYVKHWKFN